jgi:Ser/Thr protein kinase RdoA (MazF antagonist)
VEVDHKVAQQFDCPRQVARVSPLGRGHINDTFLVAFEDGPDHVLQRINHFVFPRPEWVMDNIVRVTQHLQAKVAHLPDCHQRSLRVIHTRHGRSVHRDEQGQYWRMYSRLHPMQSYDQLQTHRQAYFVGRSFGEFQGLLADLPQPRLHETIADFHHTPRRLARLLHVAGADPQRRRALAQREIDFARKREHRVELLVECQRRGEIPERITHNDTKLNNLMFDEAGNEPLCVLDLDTVMPGLVHYDFGDMIRTGCATAAEDEEDLELVDFDRHLFSGICEGYLEAGRSFLTAREVEHLAFSAILMTLEVGIRFLTDYLEGDVYFKVHHPEHNLQRARSQFELVRKLEAAEGELHDQVMQTWERSLSGEKLEVRG